jgi:hypothetical protein
MAAVENAQRKRKALSIRALADEGVPEEAIKRTIIIEFGSDEAIFDALLPEGYLIKGELKRLHQLGLGYL